VKSVLSLFDHSGLWSQPYFDAGYNVFEVDLKNWLAVDIMSVDSAAQVLEEWGEFDALLAAPPCTDFSVSGAQYWKAKDRDGRTAQAVELVHQVMHLVNLFTPTDPEYVAENGDLIWGIENPVGRLPKLVPELGEPWYFDPCDFAGYVMNGCCEQRLEELRAKKLKAINHKDVEFILTCNAYTKHTGLWGNFTRPTLKRIEPVRTCAQGSPLQRLGGKSERTKELRSATPLGFARAFFEANR
jgi:hypothetical protein